MRFASTLFVFTVLLPAQEAGSAPTQADRGITEERVREIVAWLAADERGGRNSPSPGLEAAAQWLAARFDAAGLRQVKKGSWFHEYTLPGTAVDSDTIALTLWRKLHDEPKEFALVAGQDVRLWRACDVTSGDKEPTTVAKSTDPVLQQMLNARSGRRPVVIEVATDHPYWTQSAGRRQVLGGRRRSARPVFLVRSGLLPAAAKDGEEAGWAADWSVPAPAAVEVPLKNVVALLPGTQKREEYVVVSAHYDHIGTGNPAAGDAIYNGADDDASGTTAVLAIAEAMSRQPAPQRSILFVCFSAEEKGLRGSRAFLEHPPVPREQIVANVNLEMLGRPEPGKQNQAWVTGSELSDFAAIAAAAMGRAGIEVVDFPMAKQLFAASDNYSFVRHGIVAHSISAGSLHEDYHRPGDEVEKLDISHMTQVIRGLAEFVREVADREAVPQWNEAGRARVESIQRRR